MATIVKTVEVDVSLTPVDVMKALLSFTSEDWHHLQLEVQRLLIEDGVKVSHWFNFPPSDNLSNLSDLPTPPPATPEGDREALAAAEELFTLFNDLDPELARWGATNGDIRLEDSYFWSDHQE